MELQENYAGRAEFEALCDKIKEMGKLNDETLKLEIIIEELYARLYQLDDLGNGTADNRKACVIANAGQMLINCINYLRGTLESIINK